MPRTKRARARRTLCALALVCSACLPSPTSEGGFSTDGSDAAKARAYYLATSIGLEALAFGVRRSRRPGASGAVSTATYETTRACEFGGSVVSSGQETIQTDVDPARAVVEIRSTDVHDACVLLSGTQRVTVTGAPQVTSTVHAASRAGQLWGAQTVTLVGGVRWESPDSDNPFCRLNITITVDGNTQTTVGEACGYSIAVTAQTS